MSTDVELEGNADANRCRCSSGDELLPTLKLLYGYAGFRMLELEGED